MIQKQASRHEFIVFGSKNTVSRTWTSLLLDRKT